MIKLFFLLSNLFYRIKLLNPFKTKPRSMTHEFYKEKNTWYIYLPEFLDAGLGTIDNLMMVAGAYYTVQENNHELWLCPVTEYVFGGGYPDEIYISIQS